MDVEPVNLSGNAAAGSSAVSAIRSGPPTLPGGIILDVSDPPAAVDPLPSAGEPFVPLQAAERRGRSRHAPTAWSGPGAGLMRRRCTRAPETTPGRATTILGVSSKADKWILGGRKGGSWGSCKDPLWERLLERFGVMREPAARGRGRDRSKSCLPLRAAQCPLGARRAMLGDNPSPAVPVSACLRCHFAGFRAGRSERTPLPSPPKRSRHLGADPS